MTSMTMIRILIRILLLTVNFTSVGVVAEKFCAHDQLPFQSVKSHLDGSKSHLRALGTLRVVADFHDLTNLLSTDVEIYFKSVVAQAVSVLQETLLVKRVSGNLFWGSRICETTVSVGANSGECR